MADTEHKGYDIKEAKMREDSKTSNIIKGGSEHGHAVVTDKGEVDYLRGPGDTTPTIDKKRT